MLRFSDTVDADIVRLVQISFRSLLAKEREKAQENMKTKFTHIEVIL